MTQGSKAQRVVNAVARACGRVLEDLEHRVVECVATGCDGALRLFDWLVAFGGKGLLEEDKR